MFLGVFGFLVSISASYFKFLFNTTLDNTTSVTWGGLFLVILFVSTMLALIFGNAKDMLWNDEKFVDKYMRRREMINERKKSK